MDAVNKIHLQERFLIYPPGNSRNVSQRKLAVKETIHRLLENIGEDPDRQELRRTPERVSEMLDELTAGYRVDLAELIKGAVFDVDGGDLVIVKDIDFYSLCEHHLLPFFGRVHVAYIPNGQAIGLSRIPRIVELFARRLQVQERMTRQIADFLEVVIQPQGVAVIVEGTHLCSAMRGVKTANARVVTSASLGSFKTEAGAQAQFLSQINHRCDG